MEVREGYAPLARLVADRAAVTRPLVVGIAGGVAVGKSTAAAAVSELFASRPGRGGGHRRVPLPNAVLGRPAGSCIGKGFPESYDTGGVERLPRRGAPRRAEVTVPVYSHVTYDVVARAPPDRPAGRCWCWKGSTRSGSPTGSTCGVYLHASEAAMRGLVRGPVPGAAAMLRRRAPSTRSSPTRSRRRARTGRVTSGAASTCRTCASTSGPR